MATIRPGLLDHLQPDRTRKASVFALEVVAPADPAVRVLERTTIDGGGGTVGIEDAWCVVCVGMGVGGPEHIAALEPLCAALGAELICTRDVVDAGWMKRQRQVGLTGRSVAPALYIGAATSTTRLGSSVPERSLS